MGSESAGTASGEVAAASVNWVLATINSWVSDGHPKEEIVAKIMKSFQLSDLRDAASELRKGNWCVPQISVTQEGSAGPDYSRKLAEKVFDGLVSIQNQVPVKVHFWVASEDLLKVPGARQHVEDQLDEQAVSARLAGVDVQLGLVLEKMKSTEQLANIVTALATTVTELKEELKEYKQVNIRQTEALKKAADASVQLVQEMPTSQSWAEMVGGRSRVGRLQNNQRRERSASTKRRREGEESQHPSQKQRLEVLQAQESRNAHPSPAGSLLSQDLASLAARTGDEEFVEVPRRNERRRRGGPVKQGSSKVEADGGEKPPFSVFLSGTHTATTEEVVKEKLTQCASAVGKGEANELKILKVEHIPLKIPDGEVPRSKCWKVQVESSWADHMMSSEAYPAAWGWRKWHPGPSRGKNSEDGGA